MTGAAKLNIALGFVLRNVEDGNYRYLYPHDSNTLFDKAHLLPEQIFKHESANWILWKAVLENARVQSGDSVSLLTLLYSQLYLRKSQLDVPIRFYLSLY